MISVRPGSPWRSTRMRAKCKTGSSTARIDAVAGRQDEARCPRLMTIWTHFCNDPCIEVNQAGALVLELQDLLASNGGASNHHLAATVARLSRFFSDAHRDGQRIPCCSD